MHSPLDLMTNMESDTKKHSVQVVTDATCIADLKIHHRTRMRGQPCRKPVIVREFCGADNFAVVVEHATLAVATGIVWRGNGRFVVENFTHQRLLSAAYDCV